MKDGVHVASGDYAGSVRTGDAPNYTYHHVVPNDEEWKRQTTLPDRTMCPFTAGVWDCCKAGGALDWDAENEYWTDGPDCLRLAGYAGDSVELKKL